MVDKTNVKNKKDKTEKKDVVKQHKKEVKQKKKTVKKNNEYIYNPDTKRNVKKNGNVGKKVLEKYGGGGSITSTQSSLPSSSKLPNRSPTTVKLSTMKCCPPIKINVSGQNKQLTFKNSQSSNKPFKCCEIQNSKGQNKSNAICFSYLLNNSKTNTHDQCVDIQFYEIVFNELSNIVNTLNENKTICLGSLEMSIPPIPPNPPNPPSSPSQDCNSDINVNANDETIIASLVISDACKEQDIIEFYNNLVDLINTILYEILTELLHVFTQIHIVNVTGLIKGVLIAIIVDIIYEDLCSEYGSKPKICNYPIKILMNVTMNNMSSSPIQLVAKATIAAFKSSAGLSTLQDMIKSVYVQRFKV
jgi:hypothetical protein